MLGNDASDVGRNMPSSFTVSHVKRLVDSRKSHISGSESPTLRQDDYNHSHISNELHSLEQSINNSDSGSYEWEVQVQKRNAIASKMAISLYSEALETCLQQAIELDTESNWWRDVESSSRSTAMYLLQSEPSFQASICRNLTPY